MADDPSDNPDYRKPRIAAGIALIGLAAVLMVIDALSEAYKFDSLQLGLLLGTAGMFLGVEGLRKLLR